uniref:PX domain-containing protein n=1 Tax=Anabas testudineus TaxID=64144 RepID=A0A7N6FA35_ANATE
MKEFVAVRVQDPRIQNEGSWNSYVDYKIFLHTNSKAFTAKTSCVRRRYSEFVWLKKQLQKNAGLVPVPDLPGKSFFSFSNDDFLEKRRKGLQVFLDKVVHTTVCLSDSQLHLFLQTQLPVGHIQDCVQGHTPYSVTDAILTYASSNQGFVQAHDDDSIKEPSLTVSYESMESPAPHQPCLQTETVSPELFPCGDPDPSEGRLELPDDNRVREKSSIKISEKKNILEAVVECVCEPAATFFLGNDPDDEESLSPAEESPQTSCQLQTPVEVHSPVVACGVDSVFEEESTEGEDKEGIVTLDTEEKTVPAAQAVLQPEMETEQLKGSEAANIETCECLNPVVLDVKNNYCKEQDTENSSSQEEVQEDVFSESQVSEKPVITEVNCLEHVDGSEGPTADVSCLKGPDGQREAERSDESAGREETPLHDVNGIPEVQQMDQKQVGQDVDLGGTEDESDVDSQSLTSSNESIVKVSDEESICDETEAADSYVKTVTHWSEVEASSQNILDLHINGYPVEKDISTLEDEDLQYMTSLEHNSTVAGGDLTESGDFSILESSRVPTVAVTEPAEQETSSLLSSDASEETREVEVH